MTNKEKLKDLIDNAKKHIIAKTKGIKRQNNVDFILNAFDEVKSVISANPDLPETIILNQMFNDVKDAISSTTNLEINKIQEDLSDLTTILRLVVKLNPKEGTNAHKLQQEIIEKYNKIMQYNNEIFQNAIANSNSLEISYEDV